MKKKIPIVCTHDWDDICIFKTVDGKKYLQQRCSKCKESRYLEISNNQNGSEGNETNA